MKQTKLSRQQRAVLDYCFNYFIEDIAYFAKIESEKGVTLNYKPDIAEHQFWPDSLIKELYPKERIKPALRVSFSRSLRRLEARGLIIRKRGRLWDKREHEDYEGRKIRSITLTELGYKIAKRVHYRETIKYEKPKSFEQEIRKLLKKTKKRLRQKKSVTVTDKKMIDLWPRSKNQK